MNRIDGTKLEGLSETALWTLRNRATSAMAPVPTIDDPYAVSAFRRIDYEWHRFGKPSEVHTIRATVFDMAIRTYIERRPRATVVALAEGLQTTFWRIGVPGLRWLSVDFPLMIAARATLFPEEKQVVSLAMSALDLSWADHVADPEDGVIITAEGLFMYLDRAEILRLVAECARRFPGGRLIFDSIPHWFSALTCKGLHLSEQYTIPPMPTAFSASEIVTTFGAIPGVVDVVDIQAASGLPPVTVGWGNPVVRRLALLPRMHDLRPSRTMISFGPSKLATNRGNHR